MKKILRWIPNIIFNCSEIAVIFLLGKLIGLKLDFMLIIFVAFAMIRISLGGAMHYKDWYRCMIWSALVFLSLFVVAKAGFTLSIIMTILCGITLTKRGNLHDNFINDNERGNISDIFQWKKETKYQDVDNYIKYNSLDNKLITFEKNLKERDNLSYLIYKYRFVDHKTFKEISKILDMDNPRIVEKLDAIVLAIRIYCGI